MVIVANLVSLLLGLAACAIPAVALWRPGRATRWWPIASLGACAAALVFQFVGIRQRVAAGDWAGIEDTIGAVLFAGAALVVITIVLNVSAAIVLGRRG